MNEHAIRQALEHLARGLSDGDLGRIAARWVMPALILSDAGATVVDDAGELERFFVQATEWYQSRGLVSTRPEVEHIDICRRGWRRSMCDGRLTTRLASNDRASAHTTSCSRVRMAIYRYEWR
jgi:hypothetical protein